MKTLNIFGKEVDINNYSGDEKAHLKSLLIQAKSNQLTMEDLKYKFAELKNDVIEELRKTPFKNVNRRLMLEGRLYNYSDLEVILFAPFRETIEIQKRLDIVKDVSSQIQGVDTLL